MAGSNLLHLLLYNNNRLLGVPVQGVWLFNSVMDTVAGVMEFANGGYIVEAY